VEIDFAPNETFFATLVLYGSKNGIERTSLNTCRALNAGDSEKISPETPSTARTKARRSWTQTDTKKETSSRDESSEVAEAGTWLYAARGWLACGVRGEAAGAAWLGAMWRALMGSGADPLGRWQGRALMLLVLMRVPGAGRPVLEATLVQLFRYLQTHL
jgi:hypothetical protein